MRLVVVENRRHDKEINELQRKLTQKENDCASLKQQLNDSRDREAKVRAEIKQLKQTNDEHDSMRQLTDKILNKLQSVDDKIKNHKQNTSCAHMTKSPKQPSSSEEHAHQSTDNADVEVGWSPGSISGTSTQRMEIPQLPIPPVVEQANKSVGRERVDTHNNYTSTEKQTSEISHSRENGFLNNYRTNRREQCEASKDTSQRGNKIPTIIINSDTSIFRGVIRSRKKIMVLDNVEGDKPIELMIAAIKTYATEKDVHISHVKLLRKHESFSGNAYTLQLNMDFEDYDRVVEEDYFWPEGIYWRDWNPRFKREGGFGQNFE